MMHRKASYLDKKRNPGGYMSEIIGVIVNDPEKVRGKDGIKVTFEEAGSFKNLKAALAITMPSLKDGDQMTGQASIFGTGGEEGPDIEGLEDIFNTPEAYDMLAFKTSGKKKQLMINPELTAFVKYGLVYPNKDGIWKFEPNPAAKPVLKYPHDRDTEGDRINLEGCITIYEDPRCDIKGRVHEGLYSVVVDPYYKDQAEDLTSLWCAYVIKHKTDDDVYGDKIVASFIGRPMALATAYRNTLGLAEIYDAKIQSEISGGGQGLFDFLKTEKKLHRAEFEPTQFNTKENGPIEKKQELLYEPVY
ncbi:unnamed protein product [Sphagnum balticum]